jgi:outer membrane protein assembly factor BamE
MSLRWLVTLAACLFLGAGCNIIYKQNIQQGNSLDQEDLDQLEIGMTQNQVSFLLGTPAIRDPFHHDRWDYVSSFSRRGGEPVRRLVTLNFEEGRLFSMTGVDPTDSQVVLTEDGAVAIEAATALPGVNVEDARDYEDLSLVPENLTTWSIQAGSFSTRAEADGRLNNLASQGIEATIYGQVIGNTGFFVVRIGGWDSKQEVQAALQRLEQQTGIRMFIVTPGA